MDHDNRIREVESDDLQLDTAIVFTDPDQPRIELLRCRNLLRRRGPHDMHGPGLADPMTTSGAVPPDLPIHPVSVAQNSRTRRQGRPSG